MKNATLKDIAKKANISIPTVSCILSGNFGNTRVSAEKIDRVKQIAKEMNYIPNGMARLLKQQSSKTIGYIGAMTNNPYHWEVFNDLDRILGSQGYHTLMSPVHDTTQMNKERINDLLAYKPHGVVVNTSPQALQLETLAYIKKVSPETYLASIDSLNYNDYNYLCYNTARSLLEATLLLCKKGIKKIGYIGYEKYKHKDAFNEGYESVLQALKVYGLEVDLSVEIEKPYLCTPEKAYEMTCSALKGYKETLPEVFFIYNDVVALGALRAFQELNISIPKDVSLISTDNTFLLESVSPTISGISFKMETALLKLIQHMIERKDCQIDVESELVYRQSFNP